MEIEPGRPVEALGHSLLTTEVVHQSGAPSTALRVSDGQKIIAYSGDTEWTDALLPVAAGADLFIIECYGYARYVPGHLTWEVLKPRLPDLRAKRIMATHMNSRMLEHLDEARAAKFEIAEDGAVLGFERDARPLPVVLRSPRTTRRSLRTSRFRARASKNGGAIQVLAAG